MTQRNEPFFFSISLKELNPLKKNKVVIQRIELFLVWLQELNFFQYDSRNWTLFLWIWPKNWTLFSWIWRKELNPLFLEYDAINWTVKFLKYDAKNWTFFFSKKYDSKKWTFVKIWLKELNLFFSMTQRIELFFWYDSKNWTLSDKTRRIELFFCWIRLNKLNLLLLTQKIEKNFQCDTKSFFHKHDSKHLTFFNMTHRMEPFFSIWLKELNSFQNITERTEPFSTYDSKNWTNFQ